MKRGNYDWSFHRKYFAASRAIAAIRRTHALEFQLRGRLTGFFDGLAQYTLAKSDNNTGGIDWLPANHYDLRREYGAADFDERHRFNLAGTFKAGAGFNLGALFTFSCGRPYSLTTGTDDNRDTFATNRPAGVPRNTLRLPAQAALDLRWSREFYLQKQKRDKGASLTFGVDGFNVFNRVNYAAYVGNLRSPLFGQPVAARAARRVQLNLRLKFCMNRASRFFSGRSVFYSRALTDRASHPGCRENDDV